MVRECMPAVRVHGSVRVDIERVLKRARIDVNQLGAADYEHAITNAATVLAEVDRALGVEAHLPLSTFSLTVRVCLLYQLQ